jgi:hypothetical protein
MANQMSAFVYEFTDESMDCGPIYLGVRLIDDGQECMSVESLSSWSGSTKTDMTTMDVFTSEKLFDAAQKLQEYERKFHAERSGKDKQLELAI